MASGLFFQSLPTNEDIKRYIYPTFWQEVLEYIFYFLKVFFSVAVIYVFIRTSIFDVIGISGKSMFPTYNDKDAIYIDQFTPKFSDYRRGDVIVLLSPVHLDGTRDLYIKRVIGLPGEKVVLDDGKVYIYNDDYPNGINLDENFYLPPGEKTFKNVIRETADTIRYEENLLQKDEYYVMGDNRKNSTDSRLFGRVVKSDILGKEFYRVLPAAKAGFFQVPKYNISN